MGDTYYCDNYEEVTGRDRDGTLGPANKPLDENQPVHADDSAESAAVETKVVTAPETPEPQAGVEAETA